MSNLGLERKSNTDNFRRVETSNLEWASIISSLEQDSLEKIGYGAYYDVYSIPNTKFIAKVPHQNYGNFTNSKPTEVDKKVRKHHQIVESCLKKFIPLTEFHLVTISGTQKQIVIQERSSGVMLEDLEKNTKVNIPDELNTEFKEFTLAYKELRLKGYLIESNQFIINFQENKIQVFDTNELESFEEQIEKIKPLLESLNISYVGTNINQFWDAISEALPRLQYKEIPDQRHFIFQLQSYTKLFDEVLSDSHEQLQVRGPRKKMVKEGLKKLFSILSKFTPSNFNLNLQTAILEVKLNL